MADAFIYDHVRTPRGRGKPDGSLHSITPMQLAAQTLQAVRDRNQLDTSLLDDVVLGCVSPIGEQGADIARVAALVAGYDESVPGQQLNRFCASGLEADQQRRGAGDVRPVAGRGGGRRRVDVARADRQRRRRVGRGPGRRLQHVLRAAGRRRGPDRDARRLHARDRRRVSPSRASVAQRPPGPKAASPSRSCRSGTSSAASCSTATNTCARMPRLQSLAVAEAGVRHDGRAGAASMPSRR